MRRYPGREGSESVHQNGQHSGTCKPTWHHLRVPPAFSSEGPSGRQARDLVAQTHWRSTPTGPGLVVGQAMSR